MLRNRLSPQRTPPFCHPQAAHSAHSFSWAVATGQECEGEVRVEEGEVEEKAEGGEEGFFYTFLQPLLLTKHAR